MLALLPPSSRVTRFTWSAQPAMIRVPTSVEPVKQILRTAGWVTNRSPTTLPCPGSTVNTPSGRPGLEGQLGQAQRGQRGQLGGLEHHGVAGGERRGEAPAGDRHREVPRHDHADHAERLVEGDVQAAGHRDLPAGQPLRRARVVVEHVADVARLPAGVADGVPGVAHLQRGQLLAGARPPAAANRAQQPRPVPRRHPPPRLERGAARAIAASTSASVAAPPPDRPVAGSHVGHAALAASTILHRAAAAASDRRHAIADGVRRVRGVRSHGTAPSR